MWLPKGCPTSRTAHKGLIWRFHVLAILADRDSKQVFEVQTINFTSSGTGIASRRRRCVHLERPRRLCRVRCGASAFPQSRGFNGACNQHELVESTERFVASRFVRRERVCILRSLI